jgi:hypothetical protein
MCVAKYDVRFTPESRLIFAEIEQQYREHSKVQVRRYKCKSAYSHWLSRLAFSILALPTLTDLTAKRQSIAMATLPEKYRNMLEYMATAYGIVVV